MEHASQLRKEHEANWLYNGIAHRTRESSVQPIRNNINDQIASFKTEVFFFMVSGSKRKKVAARLHVNYVTVHCQRHITNIWKLTNMLLTFIF